MNPRLLGSFTMIVAIAAAIMFTTGGRDAAIGFVCGITFASGRILIATSQSRRRTR